MDDQIYPIGQLTHTRRSVGTLKESEPDGALKAVARAKTIHYRQVYLNRSDPIAFRRGGHSSGSVGSPGYSHAKVGKVSNVPKLEDNFFV
jgi:hypothetical protein